MKRIILMFTIVAAGIIPAFAQQININENKMDRIEAAKQNFRILFDREALTEQGTDPEMMDILQKYIFGEVFQTGNLDIKTREMITCITLATMQTLPQLKSHTNAALNVGVSPVELRELVYLCAPFIGFPKTLNALSTINEVFIERGIDLPLETQGTVTEENRREKGLAIQEPLYGDRIRESLKDVPGRLGDEAARYLTEFGFGDIYTRNGLDMQTRELLIYCILTTIEAESQLISHTISNIKLGNNKERLAAAVIQTLPYIGFPPAMKALKVIARGDTQPISPVDNKVRLSRIVIDPAQLDSYNTFLTEEIEASVRLEPGVLTLYAVAEKEQLNHITILEIYANEAAYQSHITTPHFQKYKQGTLNMVQQLELIDTQALVPGLKIK